VIKRKDRVGTGAERHDAAGRHSGLVRQRGPLFEAIIRALKNENIDVAGADRLVLTEHIAVMDLLTLADALLLPDDDLALATVLKSPLFGLLEEELFALAWKRDGSLRAALTDQRPEIAARLRSSRAMRNGCRRSPSMPTCSAPAVRANVSLRGLAPRPTTSSTNSSTSPSLTSRARRPRCRAL
jgi:ATP-dependent helicase/nuclease subunit A